MKNFLNAHVMISLHLLVVALSITLAAWFAHAATGKATQILESRIFAQAELMAHLANVTDGNGADPAIAAIITDCPKRAEFEILLGRLGTLQHKDLIEVQQLFESCGNFYAERKALMVSRFERELAIYNEYVSLLSELDEHAEENSQASAWASFVSKEHERSELLTEQTVIQGNIIQFLISGATASSKSVVEQVNRAREIQESLAVLDRQIDDVRTTISK